MSDLGGMKTFTLYILGTVSFLIAYPAHAVKFDIKKGFIYEEEEIQAQEIQKEEEKLSKPLIKVVRLFNDSHRIQDPTINSVSSELNSKVKFLKIKDKDQGSEPSPSIQRGLASQETGFGLDWVKLEKDLMNVESQFGIQSMPIVKFASPSKLNTQAFTERVAYLENKLSLPKVEKETPIFTLLKRIAVIQEKLGVQESQTIDFDLNYLESY